jgi:hypothetical protein
VGALHSLIQTRTTRQPFFFARCQPS